MAHFFNFILWVISEHIYIYFRYVFLRNLQWNLYDSLWISSIQNGCFALWTDVKVWYGVYRVVNRFCKRSFCSVFKNNRFVFRKKLSFLKTTHSFWTFRKRLAILFENYFLLKRFATVFIGLFLKNDRFWKNKFLWTIMLTIVNEGSSLTIVNETTNFIKTVVFGEKNYMQLYWMSSSMKFNSCGELKLLAIFLKTTQW